MHALDPRKQVGQYGHDSWTSQRGLPGEAVYQILQSKDGYLWIRTGSGLCRFDGVRFVSMDAAIGNEPVRAIAMGVDGDLLIRTTSRTVIYRDQQFSDYLPPAPLPDGSILTLFESRKHNVFVGADDFIYETKKDGPRMLRGRTTQIAAFLEDDAGKVWIGGSTALFEYSGGRLSEPFNMVPYGSATKALMEDHLHRLWAGTGNGLYRLDGYQSSLKPVAQPGVPTQVDALIEDRQGNIWVGTESSGLVRFTPGETSPVASVAGLTDSNVLSLFEDREGSIWIGTASGLDRLRDTKLTAFTMAEGLPSNKVSALAVRDGSLALFCDTGGLARIANDTVTAFDRNAELPSLYGSALFQSRDGSLWLGAVRGLTRIQDGKVTVYAGDGHFNKGFISAISEDSESLIVTNAESHIYRFKDGKVLPFLFDGKVTPLTTADDYVFVMDYDGKGTLWLGTAHGFFKLAPGGPPQKALQTQVDFQVTSIFDDHAGNLWLGGRTPGLVQFRIADGRVTRYDKRAGLFDAYLSHIAADDDGNLWMSTEAGIYEARRKDLEDFADGRASTVPSTVYGLADGMKTTQFPSGNSQPNLSRTLDGRLWFSSAKGIVVVDPKHMKRNDLVPPVLLETVVVDGAVQPSRGDLKITPGMDDIEFHYTALSFLVPERVRFKYKLEGYDRDWVDAGPRRAAYYTKLPPGTYRFRVIAANDDGVWNQDGASVNIVLEPHFYQTRLFLCVCAMLAVLGIIAGNRFNTRRIRTRAEELTSLVEERTAELRQSHLELEHLAHIDSLTALPNRRMFIQDFRKMRTMSRQSRFSLLLIDFDRFKQINDTFGHDAGDAFLVEAAARLKSAIRETDCVARLGGDEFAILLTGDNQSRDTDPVCSRIVHSFKAPIRFNRVDIAATISVGIAIFPRDGDTEEDLYKSADLALYEAKQMGRNLCRSYRPEMRHGNLSAQQNSESAVFSDAAK